MDGQEAWSELLPVLIFEYDLEFPAIGSCFLLPTKQKHEACGKLVVGNALCLRRTKGGRNSEKKIWLVRWQKRIGREILVSSSF